MTCSTMRLQCFVFLVLVWLLGNSSAEESTTEGDPNQSDIYFNETTKHLNANAESPVDEGGSKLKVDSQEDSENKTGNSRDKTEKNWSMTHFLEYLMSFVYGQKEEEKRNTSSGNKIEKQQYTLNSFSKLKEECSSEECRWDEEGEKHDPIDPNPDVAFDEINEGKRHRQKDLPMSEDRRKAREDPNKTLGTLEDKEVGGPGKNDVQDSNVGRFSEPSQFGEGTSKPQSSGESTADKTSKSKSGGGIVEGKNASNASKQANSKKIYEDNSRKNKNDVEKRKSLGSFQTRDETKRENDENRIDYDLMQVGPKTASEKFGSVAVRKKRFVEQERTMKEDDSNSNSRDYENDEPHIPDEPSEIDESQQYDYYLEYTLSREEYDEEYDEFLADSTDNENDSDEDDDDDEYDKDKYDETNHEKSDAEYETLFPRQSNNDMIYPAARLNESVVSSNQTSVINSYQPQETFDTILEYLYKYSNKPLFVSIKSKNGTMNGAKK